MSGRAYPGGLFQVRGAVRGPGNEPTKRSLRTIWAYWSRWWAHRGPLKCTGVDGLVLNLDGGPLPAGLIQTSLAARQLNLLRTGLGGEPFRAHSSTWVNCVSVAASALRAQV
jgi:hypothetical protein